ncbi:MAG TPA: MFS transporter [Candidatus Limnocylindrales bacterium]|nr:MFS transporter [Candidatus Limnocylindrales bacterium]
MAVALVTAASLLGDTLLYTALPVSAARLGLDGLAVGLALSLNRWVRLFTNPLAARLYERFPAGGLVVAALLLATASTALYALPATLAVFLGARLVWGFCWSLLRLGSLVSAIDEAGPRAGRKLGEMRAIYGLGYLGGALYAPVAIETIGWEGTALLAAALTLLLGAGPAFIAAPWRRGAHVASDVERISLWEPRLTGLFAIALAQYFLYAGLVAVAGGLLIGTRYADGGPLFGWIVPATFVAGAFVLTQRISQVVWTPLAGRLADRAAGRTLVLSTLAAAAGIAVLALPVGPTAFVAAAAVAFFAGISGVIAVELAIARRSSPHDRPRVLAAYNTWADIGAAAGALAGGALAFLGTDLVLAAGAALALLVLPVWTFARGGESTA